jgi:hypothetical protein
MPAASSRCGSAPKESSCPGRRPSSSTATARSAGCIAPARSPSGCRRTKCSRRSTSSCLEDRSWQPFLADGCWSTSPLAGLQVPWRGGTCRARGGPPPFPGRAVSPRQETGGSSVPYDDGDLWQYLANVWHRAKIDPDADYWARKRPRTPEEDALLGTMTDREVARGPRRRCSQRPGAAPRGDAGRAEREDWRIITEATAGLGDAAGAEAQLARRVP